MRTAESRARGFTGNISTAAGILILKERNIVEGMNTNIMDINRILDEARELGCSDLHFTAGLPPVVRLAWLASK